MTSRLVRVFAYTLAATPTDPAPTWITHWREDPQEHTPASHGGTT